MTPFDEARDRADAVLAEALHWFPVRHHSPAVARHLRATLRARKPKLVLIEGPPDANGLVEHIVAAKTKPPIAIYTSFRDDQNVLGLAGVASPSPERMVRPPSVVQVPARLSAWYPLLPYSPEYVAMKTAAELGAEVVFIDLPHYARVVSSGPALPQDGVPDAATATEHLMTRSSFYQSLASAAGYRTFDETWDSLFELGRHEDPEAFRRDLAYFCAGARWTTDPAQILSDGTVERERQMWRTIRGELDRRKLRDEEAIVVCGGFHLFMDRDGADPPPIPVGTLYTTLAPFSYFRTSELSGYGAGNRAPRYYQRLWEHAEAGRTADDAMIEQVVAALTLGRRAGEALSSADAVSIAQIARGLAGLRRRAHPALDDVQDAIVTCCCKGRPDEDGVHLLAAMKDAAVGTAVGKVTSALGQLPLVHDFHDQLHELDLGEVIGRDRKILVEVDRRDPLGARRSAWFHRLVQIGIPLCKLQETPLGSSLVFRERWRASWSPAVQQALIEHNLYGDTVEAAAAARLEEEIATEPAVAEAVSRRWRKAVDMDLSALATRLEETCGRAIDDDRRVASLANALVDLQILGKHAGFRGLRRDVLDDLRTRAFGRACFAIPDAANVPDDEQAGVMGALGILAETVLSDPSLDRVLYATNVRSAAELTESPFLRGTFVGVLAEIREMSAEELATHVSAYARSLPEVRLNAGAFLEGVFAVSRTSILLGADELVAAIDELLRSAEWDGFVTMLPRLRHAFERLHDRQRDSFADRVASRYGKTGGEALTRLPTSVSAAVALAQIDARVAAILAEWET